MGHRRGRHGILAAGVLIVCLCVPEARGDVSLSDLVAGGDGSGNAPPENIGISADDGTFQTAYRKDNIFNTGDNPQAAGAASPYLDSVFILDRLPMPINSKGVAFNFQPGDPSTFIWGHILKDRTHDIQSGYLDVSLGGATFRTGIGIHAASGITFDLEAIRAQLADPAEATFFSGTLGIDRCAGNVNNYLI